ncbi:MAG: RNA-binding domain-containing protein [Dehalococcoidia bacterium]
MEMAEPPTFVDALVRAICRAASFNRLDQAPPAVVLWPDPAREWEPLFPVVRERLPAYMLGSYLPSELTGPAPWLRCVIARALPNPPSGDATPVLYLPGVGARDLRSLGHCPQALQILIELQYLGVLWTQPDSKEWTVSGFLSSRVGGLGIEMRNDTRTRAAMLKALLPLADVSLARLREEAPWRALDFEALLAPTQGSGSLDLHSLIRQGESAILEFKSTAWWNIKAAQATANMPQIIVKTVAAFLNSREGGTLLIGVEDDGTIHGLDDDYRTFPRDKQNQDQYELKLMHLLLGAFGKGCGPYLRISLHEVERREICMVRIEPAPEPAFFEEEKREVFYIRMGNQSQPLTMSEAVKYIKRRWPDHG